MPQHEEAWELTGLAGRGRFGVVYRAEGGDGVIVAIKRASDAWGDLKRHKDLCALLGRAGTPAVVLPLAWVRARDADWAVLPWIDGVDLTAVETPVPPRVAADLIAEVAAVMLSVHRVGGLPPAFDLRPSHVRLTATGGVALVDLWHGAPRLDEAELAAWLAPETRLRRSERRSDVYAMGLLLHHLLGGEPPGPAETHLGRHAVQLSLAIDSLVDAGVPEDLIALVSDMLAFRASSRPDYTEVLTRVELLVERLEGPLIDHWARDRVRGWMEAQKLEVDGRIGSRIVATHFEATQDTDGLAHVGSAAVDEPITEDQVATVPPEAHRPGRRGRIPTLPPEPFSELADLGEVLAEETEDDSTPPTISARTHGFRPQGRSVVDPQPLVQAAGPTEPLPALLEARPENTQEEPDAAAAVLVPAAGAGLPGWAYGAMAIGALVLIGVPLWWLVGAGAEPPAIASTEPATHLAVAPEPAPTAAPPTRAAPPPAPPAAAIAAPPAAPEPQGTEAAAPDPAPVAVDGGKEAPEPASQPAPAPAATTPPEPVGVLVRLAGDPAEVWLVSPNGARLQLPGRAPVGPYRVEASFGGAAAAAAGDLVVADSDTIVLSCNALFARCSIQ